MTDTLYIYEFHAAASRFWRHCRRNAEAFLPLNPAPGIAAAPFSGPAAGAGGASASQPTRNVSASGTGGE